MARVIMAKEHLMQRLMQSLALEKMKLLEISWFGPH
jgi:hypothetical protein